MQMKHYIAKGILFMVFFFSCTSMFAQQRPRDYAAQWKKIDELLNKGLTKSALAEVDKVYALSKKDGNDPQLIKALLYKFTLNQSVEENANVKNIDTLEKEIKTAKEPAKSILESITAEMYWNIFQQQRWKIYNRTKTDTSFKKNDILTWSADDFHDIISKLYLASIEDDKLLKQTKLEPFDAIILKGNVRYLRPTLYDLLAHRALDYSKSDENDITKPAYAFEIKSEKAFAPASEFVRQKFENKDSTSLHYKALLIFQDLLAFHTDDAKPDDVIDADIERLNFMKQYGVMVNKDELYIAALQNIANQFSNNAASAQASYLIAQQIFDKANPNQKNVDTARYSVRKAKEIAEVTANKFPESEGGINAKNLLNQILHKDLSLTSEKVNIPGEPFRTLVTYKNFSSLNFRIIEMTPQFKKLIESNDVNDALWKKLIAQRFVRSWKQNLVATDDYLSHSVEIKVDALPVGQYALLASVSNDFNLDKNPLAVQYFHVSNISYINNGPEYFILNRETGQPLEGAKVQVWKQQYDYNTRKNSLEKKELLTADEHGYIKVSPNKKSETSYIRLEIFYQNDHLFLDDYQYSYSYNTGANNDDYEDQEDYDDDKAKIFLFTDRSIYRPGQLVYFKGIGVTQNYKTKKNQLLQSKDSITLLLFDANGQKADSINVLLNEYGSFNGKFRLPENKLTGDFSIEVVDYENSSVDFSVEEYKRPKFLTEFEKVKGSYRVGDSLSITGFAKAYAGNNIDGAKVKYRVTRVARFIYPWIFWRWPQPSSQPLEITNGEITTDSDGKFTIKFAAIADLSIDKNTDPVFDYKVEADVTDINGETRSGNIIVPVGYKTLDLQITLPSKDAIPVDSLKHLFVSTKNLSGEFEPSKVEVKIYRLQPPQRLIRNRYWAQPDEFIMSKEEFVKYFPNDEYNEENKKESWLKGEMVFSKTDSTKPVGNWQLPSVIFSQGWYVAEATSMDKYGQNVKDVKYFQLYDMNAASLPAPAYTWNTVLKNVVEPGEKAQLISGTSANDVFVIQQIDKEQLTIKKKGNSDFEFFNLNNEKKNFELKANEDDRGGFGVSQFFVKDNRIYFRGFNILVPWTNKELNISFDTYRDKTLPGSEEKWKVKISGNKEQKVAAEMLASMYDASLDQFKPHSWSALNIWPTYSGYNEWAGNQNFSSANSIEKYWNEKYIEQKEQNYDVLNYLPNNFNSGVNIRIRGISSIAQNLPSAAPGLIARESNLQDVVVVGYGSKKKSNGYSEADSTLVINQTKENPIDQSQIQIRKNFNETAFFFPELRTDKDGNIEFSFTMPEALTQWKLMTLAHTKDLASGYAERTVITQKDLMVQPNAPRFLREGDQMEFTAKIVNLSDNDVSGSSELHLLNASTMNPVDGWFKNNNPSQSFNAKAGQSALVKFHIEIPVNFNDAVVYRIVAKAGDVSDGEEAAIPVVTNRMLVTETLPLPMRGDGTKNFKFEKLLHSSSTGGGREEATLSSYGLTVEYTTNPAWYAVQALPYLMEYPYECAEQTFNRYYANAIATKIVNASPKLKAVFETWKTADTAALMSNLQKNEELKSVLLEETPWVMQAQSEEQQKKNIALLFDMTRMSLQLESAIQQLSGMQSPNGGFVWFKGGPDNRYMTQYIVTGIGHLKKLNALPTFQQSELKSILDKAIPYLDKMLKKDYDDLIKYKTNLKENNLSTIEIQYLYMRSFFPEYPVAKETQTALNYYREQSKKYWLSQSKYMQAMIALSLSRTNNNSAAEDIIKSLKENSIDNEELGMYWKEWDNHGYWWYQAPIESQAMMIEAYSEIEKDLKTIDDLKTWLLKNKQTNNWKTTKATAEACYALLLQGTDWLSQEKTVSLKLGNTAISSKDEKQEVGTGYFKRKIDGDKVKPEMGNISVTVSSPVNQSINKPSDSYRINPSASWGSVYWQYFENLDKITFSETPLKLSKKLFIEKNSDNGPVLVPVNDGDKLHIGDKIKVRIELRVDRDMEYIHMKDMRASCMEPTNVLSEYKYQDGLGYYETTKDVSTNFFFGYLNKGTYVFEYPMFVTHSGNFSNGITTIQCMYAPEFTAHSEGIRVKVE